LIPNWFVNRGANAGRGVFKADTSASIWPLKSPAWYLQQNNSVSKIQKTITTDMTPNTKQNCLPLITQKELYISWQNLTSLDQKLLLPLKFRCKMNSYTASLHIQATYRNNYYWTRSCEQSLCCLHSTESWNLQ
jgi:hypothetical protein